MARKSLFWGLTLILVVALVSLIIRGRQMEKETAAQPKEIMHQASILPTRVIAPPDLEIVRSTMEIRPDHTALHEVEIKNHGDVPYGGILLKFTYQNQIGESLLSKTFPLKSVRILPAGVSHAPAIVIPGVPAATKIFRVTIQYADMQPAGSVEGN
jgi:hypothetical protein